MPSFERTDIDGNSFRLKITLHPDDYIPTFNKELKTYRKEASLKGFRKGQAPIAYIKRMFGGDLYGRIVINGLSDGLSEYLQEHKIKMVGQPIFADDMAPELNLDYKTTPADQNAYYDIGFVNDFELEGLDNSLTLEQMVPSDLDELAEKDLENARKRGGEHKEVSEDIQDNDMLTIAAVEVDDENAPIEGGWETDVTILVNTVKDEEIKKMLLDSKLDDIIFFNARNVEQFDKEEMYRKYFLNIPEDDERTLTDNFRGEITKVSRVIEAELNEEFYTKMFGEEVKTKEEAVEMLKKGIDAYYKNQTHHVLRRAARDTLVKSTNIPLPKDLLKKWVASINESTTMEDVEAVEDVLFEEVQWSLIREKLEAEIDVFATDEEIEAAARAQVRGYFQGQALPEDIIEPLVKRFTEDENSRREMIQQVETNKFYEELLKRFNIEEKLIHSEELHKQLEEISKAATAWNDKSQQLSALLADNRNA